MGASGNYSKHPKGRSHTYRILIKHRGKLSELYLEDLKNSIWEYFGDISKDDIQINRVNRKGASD